MGSKLTEFLRRLVNPKQGEASRPEPVAAVEYNGYSIRPTPRRQGSEWLTAGVIAKQFPDGVKEHQFIRVDTHANQADAANFSIYKAKQIIDEQGDKMFRTG
ncbi:MAG: HlyU family transcriptional regulator [Pseudomonadota bacterium]